MCQKIVHCFWIARVMPPCSHMVYGLLCRAPLIYIACTIVEIPPTYYVLFLCLAEPEEELLCYD